jgi:hypothetical protein
MEINMTYDMRNQVPVTFHCLWGGDFSIEDFLKPPFMPKKNRIGTHTRSLSFLSFFLLFLLFLSSIDVPPFAHFISLTLCVSTKGWFGTNCQGLGGHTLRANWVREFMKFKPVDSFGKCLHTKDLPSEMQFPIYSNHGESMKNKVRIFRNYKFALVMENHNVTDYVTEKVVNALQAGSVPIYVGSETIDDWVPAKSTIKASDFPSLRELAGRERKKERKK